MERDVREWVPEQGSCFTSESLDLSEDSLTAQPKWGHGF